MKTLKQRLDENFNESSYADSNDSATIKDFKPTDNETMINVDGRNYFLKKEKDTTHFDMVTPTYKKPTDLVWHEKGLSQGIHIGQRRGEPYIDDVRSWLTGKLKSKDLFGKKYTGSTML